MRQVVNSGLLYMNNKRMIVYWCLRMSQECISEEISSKGQMAKETIYNGYKLASMSVCMYVQIPKKHYALILIQLEE